MQWYSFWRNIDARGWALLGTLYGSFSSNKPFIGLNCAKWREKKGNVTAPYRDSESGQPENEKKNEFTQKLKLNKILMNLL